ncbi:hypothetical protein DUHN20_12770 [Helicobacter pylori]
MKLYNKIQELINESESLKQKNNEVLGLAKNELSELVKQVLTNALMLEADVLNNKMNIENEIAYNLKRKELIQRGQARR